jgi:hypothetical protein
MAEPQPKTIHEGATTGDIEDEVQTAEDRKAAAALASLDARGDEGSSSAAVDQDAANKAIKSLGTAPAAAADKKEVKKVKVEAADVNLLVSLPPYPPDAPFASSCSGFHWVKTLSYGRVACSCARSPCGDEDKRRIIRQKGASGSDWLLTGAVCATG